MIIPTNHEYMATAAPCASPKSPGGSRFLPLSRSYELATSALLKLKKSLSMQKPKRSLSTTMDTDEPTPRPRGRKRFLGRRVSFASQPVVVETRPEDAARADLKNRCAMFTAALHAEYAPNSAVVRHFTEFVSRDASSCTQQEYRFRVSSICHLLKQNGNKPLLHAFYSLLPRWVFVRTPPPPPPPPPDFNFRLGCPPHPAPALAGAAPGRPRHVATTDL